MKSVGALLVDPQTYYNRVLLLTSLTRNVANKKFQKKTHDLSIVLTTRFYCDIKIIISVTINQNREC